MNEDYLEELLELVEPLSGDMDMRWEVYWVLIFMDYRLEELILDVIGCLDAPV